MGKSIGDRFKSAIKSASKELLGVTQQNAPAPTPKPAPTKQKMGSVKICPHCGATVQSYQGKCPECEYTFEGTDANAAVKALQRALEQERNKGFFKEKNEKAVIDNFAIPTDKATLLNFITWLEPQSKRKDEELGDAYYRKYTECVKKAQVIFPNDPDLQPFVSSFAQKDKKRTNAKTRQKILSNQWTWIGLVVIVIALIILFFILKPKPIQKNLEKSSAAIEKAIKEGDTHKATEIFLAFEGDKKYNIVDLSEREVYALVDACLAADNFEDAYRIGKYRNAEFGGYAYPEIASKLYKYCINHDDFETAKDIYQEGWPAEQDYNGTYIMDVVLRLCGQGKKAEAQNFLENNISLVTYDYSHRDKLATCEYKKDKDHGYYIEQERICVKKVIQDIINRY